MMRQHILGLWLIVLCHLHLDAQTWTIPSTTDAVRSRPVFGEARKQIFNQLKPGMPGYKQHKRFEYYALPRLGPDGRLGNPSARNLAAYEASPLISPQSGSRTYHGNWSFIGPVELQLINGDSANNLGRVNRFAFHPTDPDIVFCATAGGGLWKTEDKGLHWDPLTEGVPVMNTCGIAMDPTDTDNLYLLSGDGSGNGSFYHYSTFSRNSVGMYISTDGGQIWKPSGLIFDETDEVFTYNLHMKPDDPQTLYACTSIGLFRTQDAGDTWDTIKHGIIYEIEFKPGQPNHLYVVDKEYVYVSQNGGSTWVDSTYIPPIDGETGRMCISVCENNPAMVYLIASPIDTLTTLDTVPDHRGLWLSVNSGDSFIQMSTRPNLLAASNPLEFKSQAWYDFSLECNPLDFNDIAVSAIGIWKSDDAGVTWTHDNGINTLYHADVHAMEVNPLDNTMWVATDGGVFMSDDFGETYAFRSGHLGITQYYKLASSFHMPDYTLAGSQDNGTHLRDDIELLHDRVIFGDGMVSAFHPLSPRIVWTSIQDGAIFISQDSGHTFTSVLPAVDIPVGSDTSEWVTPILVDYSDTNTVYIGFKPIFKSTDLGQNFFTISADTISAHRFLVSSMANPDRLFAGDCYDCDATDADFRLYRSENAGLTWERIDGNAGFPAAEFVVGATVHPADDDDMWISCGRYNATKKVFRTINGGDTWQNMTGSLPNVPVNVILCDASPGAPAGAVYAGTDIGVFYRNDDLGDWIFFSNNLPRVEITDIAIDQLDQTLKIATYGRGLWESPLFTSCPPTILLSALNQNVGHSYYHSASTQIFSSARVDGYGSIVRYQAGSAIYLTEGFRATAKNKASFKTLLQSCD